MAPRLPFLSGDIGTVAGGRASREHTGRCTTRAVIMAAEAQEGVVADFLGAVETGSSAAENALL